MKIDPEIDLPAGETAAEFAKCASRISSIAFMFCGIVLVFLLFNAWTIKKANPLNNPEIEHLQKRLAELEKEGNETEKIQIISRLREKDAVLRTKYFHSLKIARKGWFLLLAGSAFFLISFKIAAILNRKPPSPPDKSKKTNALPNTADAYAIAVFIAAAAIAVIILSFSENNQNSIEMTERVFSKEKND